MLPLTDQSLVIIDGVRTPFAKFQTDLAPASAVDLGRTAVAALLARTDLDPSLIDETLFGCVAQPADAANLARVIALRAGIPEEIPAMTVQRNCASGLEALTLAADRIAGKRGEVFVVGGVESMSQIPLLVPPQTSQKLSDWQRAKTGAQRARAVSAFRLSDLSPIIALRLGLYDPVVGMNMGETAELLAREFRISRKEQDAFALRSHEKATAAMEWLQTEIVPVYRASKTNQVVTTDNGIRPNQNLAALAKRTPVFDRNTGTVTAGNASQITDGAVALLVMTLGKANQLGFTPLGRLVDHVYTGCDPRRMGLGPVQAIKGLCENAKLCPEDMDLVEINEAFAAQVLSVLVALEKEGLPVQRETLNPQGGAIALGHPVGASGARLALTALYQLKHRDQQRALISLCVGGGQGGAAILERIP
ncbi:MAG: thiolase family protein [Verrucomicrobiota bacterium]